jgi:hypothetical protein
MTYSIHLLYADGRGSYLSIKGRSEWKTRRVAINHARTMSQLKTRDGIMRDLVALEVEGEFKGQVIKTFEVQ